MKSLDLEKLTIAYPEIAREKLSEAMALLQKATEVGGLIGSRHMRVPFNRSCGVAPDSKLQDPRTIKLRTRP